MKTRVNNNLERNRLEEGTIKWHIERESMDFYFEFGERIDGDGDVDHMVDGVWCMNRHNS